MTEQDLAGFTGTDGYHRLSISRNLLATDGVRYLAEKGGAFWLMDELALFFCPKAQGKDEFFVFGIKRHEEGGATLYGNFGRGGANFMEKRIEYTDFPLREYEIYVQWSDFHNAWIAMLKGEY